MTIEQLIVRFEPMCGWLARQYFAPGLTREDIAQEARIGVYKAIVTYDPSRGSSLHTFARLSAERQVITAVKMAQRGKHGPLNDASSLDAPVAEDGASLGELLPSPPRNLASEMTLREELDHLTAHLSTELTALEDESLASIVAGESYDAIAERIGVSVKSIDNAIRRARSKARVIVRELGLGLGSEAA